MTNHLSSRLNWVLELEHNLINTTFNELTWMVRSVTVQATVHVTANGAMNITCRFTDQLDLRPENDRKIYFGKKSRPRGYNIASSILGVMYHDAMGINEKMKVHATWESSIHF